MFYSTEPYEVEKKDTFADLDSLAILTDGKYSMSSDMYMVLPGYEYTSALPFYEGAISTLKEGECLVSENVMKLRNAHVGDELLFKGVVDEGSAKIVGKLPSMKGLQNLHHGVIVIGYGRYIEDAMRTSRPRYVTFGRDFKNFGTIHIEGNLLPKERDLQREYEIITPRITIGVLVLAFAEALVALGWYLDDLREKKAIIVAGSRPANVFWHFFRKKLIYAVAPVAVIFALFVLLHLEYLLSSLVLFAIFLLVSIVAGLLESFALTWRS